MWFTSETWMGLSEFGGNIIIRNLTKEKEANMPKENSNCCKNIPHELTVDDLYLTAKTPACPSTRQSFIETFGFKVQLNDPKLKDWIIKKNLEKDFENNLPDHYAVIFPEWQPSINEIVWVCGKELNWIGRIFEYDNNDNEFKISDQSGEKYWIHTSEVKPISERDFQVGDWVVSKNDNEAYEIIPDGTDDEDWQMCASWLNERPQDFKLIISPAIPEVK